MIYDGDTTIERSIRNSQFLDHKVRIFFVVEICIDRKIDSKFVIFRLGKDIDKRIFISMKINVIS